MALLEGELHGREAINGKGKLCWLGSPWKVMSVEGHGTNNKWKIQMPAYNNQDSIYPLQGALPCESVVWRLFWVVLGLQERKYLSSCTKFRMRVNRFPGTELITWREQENLIYRWRGECEHSQYCWFNTQSLTGGVRGGEDEEGSKVLQRWRLRGQDRQEEHWVILLWTNDRNLSRLV